MQSCISEGRMMLGCREDGQRVSYRSGEWMDKCEKFRLTEGCFPNAWIGRILINSLEPVIISLILSLWSYNSFTHFYVEQLCSHSLVSWGDARSLIFDVKFSLCSRVHRWSHHDTVTLFNRGNKEIFCQGEGLMGICYHFSFAMPPELFLLWIGLYVMFGMIPGTASVSVSSR